MNERLVISSESALVQDLRVIADYGQIYVFDSLNPFDQADNPYLAALHDATSSRRFVGIASGIVDLMTPGQWNFNTPLRLEVHPVQPANDSDKWNHQVELDFDCPSGVIVFEGSGGAASVTAAVPNGQYRSRISGAGYRVLGAAGADGEDHYRLQLWQRTIETPPVLLKYWAGWDAYH